MKQNLQILNVDDDKMMTKSLVDIVSMKGFQAIAACSGEESLQIVRQHKIDVLLTDVKMPDMDGVELYLQVKKIQPDVIAILMTAYAADDIIRRGLTEGVSVVLTKPLNIDFLIEIFEACRVSRPTSGSPLSPLWF